MTHILIKLVKTAAKGGYDVEITGVDPTNEDYIIGTINTKQGEA